MPMTKSSLIDAVAADADLPRKRARQVINTIFDTMTNALAEGKRIEMRGFGTFAVRVYDGYTGRNPRTSVPVEVDPKRSVHFKVGKELRERINGAEDVELEDDGDESDDT